jgi:hypothetical protein
MQQQKQKQQASLGPAARQSTCFEELVFATAHSNSSTGKACHRSALRSQQAGHLVIMNLLQAPTSFALIRCLHCSIAQHIMAP